MKNAKKSLKFLFYGHGGSKNHGCEAIVQASQLILNKSYNYDLVVSSDDVEADGIFLTNVKKLISNKTLAPHSRLWKLHGVFDKLFGKPEWFTRYVTHRGFFSSKNEVQSSDLTFSIGGDTYCGPNPVWLYEHNKEIDRLGRKRVLWGCSVDPQYIDTTMKSDLMGYSLIVTRETLSFEGLRNKGISKVALYPDPAFQLPIDTSQVPDYMAKDEYIGINLSPVVIRSEKVAGMGFNSYRQLIKHLLDTTHYKIILVPHVVIDKSSDYECMLPFYEEFKSTNRIHLLSPDLSASQYKGVISKCVAFIASRTHASIAAYSTCIPTLVVGYSIKARGIAKDIFGNEKDMVIPIQTMNDPNELVKAFQKILDNREETRKHLETFMPNYKAKALESAIELQRFL